MIRISLPYLFGLAENLEPLSRVHANQSIATYIMDFWRAESQLNELLSSSVFTRSLRSSVAHGNTLLQAINKVTATEDWNQELSPTDWYAITNAYTQYKTALLAELGILPSYFVSPKEPYDTEHLLSRGEALFPSPLLAKVPEAVFDAREAAIALAYERGTACGFHVFRVLEAVLRRYYDVVTGGAAKPKVRNIGVYLAAMRKADAGDQKVLAALKQITDFHRNPLIHPDVALGIEEAITILGVFRSAIGLMLTELPDAPTTTLTGAA